MKREVRRGGERKSTEQKDEGSCARKTEGCQEIPPESGARGGGEARRHASSKRLFSPLAIRVWRHEKKKKRESDPPDELSIAPVCFCSPFLSSLSSLIAPLCRLLLLCPPLPHRPLKQGHDEYNNDGPDALYHHLVLVLCEWEPHYHEILIKPLYPSRSSPTLMHAMRLTNPMICLVI